MQVCAGAALSCSVDLCLRRQDARHVLAPHARLFYNQRPLRGAPGGEGGGVA